MKILILGDVCGPSGMKVVKDKLREIIKNKNIDFTIVNGENAASNGKGITKKNSYRAQKYDKSWKKSSWKKKRGRRFPWSQERTNDPQNK